MSDVKLPSYVYKSKNRWVVRKSFSDFDDYYKSFDNVFDAINHRNKMVDCNWNVPELSDEVRLERAVREYFVRVCKDSTKRWYKVKRKGGGSLDKTKDIYEALFYRDLYSESDLSLEEIPKIKDCDLVTDNPYLKEGLKFPLPPRLVLEKEPSKRGRGKIVKKSVSSYSIYLGRKHVCSCRTYEQSFYVKQEMNKIDWDLSRLQEVLDNYPIFYTRLLQFYIYLSKDSRRGDWLLTIPRDKSDDGKIQHIHYSKIEDALWERDFLVEHEWDYDLLVECIDDSLNPYYDMELPPYPERKIRNISPRKSHDEDFLKLAEIIREEPLITIKDLASRIGATAPTLRNWFKQYNTNSKEFRSVVLDGKNPCEVFKQKELIYTPDLSKSLPANFNNYVHYARDRKSKYIVNRKDVYYGAYASKETAEKVVKELEKVNWDKSKLDEIKKSLGIRRHVHEFMYIYRTHPKVNSWQIRKKIKGKNVGFGVYQDIEFAKLIRDILVGFEFKCDDLDRLRRFGEWIVFVRGLYYGNMFGGVRL